MIKLLEPLYKTANGIPICPIDILYGWRLSIAKEMNTWHIRAVLHILFLIQPFRMLAFSQDMPRWLPIRRQERVSRAHQQEVQP